MNFKLNNKGSKCIWLSLGKSFCFALIALSLFWSPVTHAGVLSFLSDMFSGQDALAQTETIIKTNSQNMPLPEPVINSELALRTGSGVVIDGGDALLSEVGPSNVAPEAINNSNGQISTYVVRSGDTLAGIAKMFDVSVNTLLWANDMTKGSTLKIGQTLVILPISGVIHTVVRGDTLSTIAKKYSGDIDEIASFNDLKVSAILAIGDTVLIPDGQVSSSIRPSTSGSSLVTSGGPDLNGDYIKPFVSGRRTQGLHGYNAVDYGMPVGTPIYAAAKGSILISKNSGWNGGYGDYIVIKHPNGTQTVYAHLSQTVISVGQTVTQGQLIGYSGNTGKSTGPHLHFEIRGAKNPF